MSRFQAWQSGTALVTALSLVAGAAAPMVIQAPAQAQVSFSDVSADYWASGFILALAKQGIISGFPDGSFRPNEPVTRAQFAALVRQAFPRSPMRPAVRFVDVAPNYWGAAAIQTAYTTGFLAGYPGNVFRPEENISRAQVLVSLANGSGYVASNPVATTLQIYRDANSIPNWATSSIAAATEKRIVVNYPDVNSLNPNRPATRAEVAAFLYQTLVNSGQLAAIASPYIVGQASTPQPGVQIPAGTVIPVRYDAAEKIYIAPQEPAPVPVTLLVDRDIVAANGRVLIPANSRVAGELRVESNGARFHALTVVLPDGSSRRLNATSALLTRTEEITRGANVLEILAGTALGAGAAAAIAGVTGDKAIATEEVLGGAVAGTLLGVFLGRDRVSLITIDPDTDLDLTLNAPFAVQ
ncbi:MAG: S-layer homology domain-containing protein [Synechococcales cyanobacterium C42_A2020_086]|jgi:hypothetical protein|nr:S-layer homology domain-containing protein [Synechococcales cyanobacterium C42_A2020_086]